MLSKIALVVILYVNAVTTATVKQAAAPECVSKCSIYSRYVSPQCGDDNSCLCSDTEYQNAVYQCLYSQCPTSQFANALHHTLAICHKDPSEEKSPALLKQGVGQQRRKRDVQMPMASVSNSAPGASVTRSAGGGQSVTRSAGAQSVTRSASVGRPTASVSRSASVGRPTASVNRSASVGRPTASVNRSVSASNYNRGGSMRAAPTLSAMVPMYKRSR